MSSAVKAMVSFVVPAPYSGAYHTTGAKRLSTPRMMYLCGLFMPPQMLRGLPPQPHGM